MTKKRIKNILTVVLAVVFLLSAGMTVRQQILYQQITADSDQAVQVAGLRKPKAPVPAEADAQEPPPAADDPRPEDVKELDSVNLNALREVNADVWGWIAIPGTQLSYPLMRGEDNQFYLNHNWMQEPSDGGAVFLECTDDGTFSGFHTIIYGHRMRNESMFGLLRHYNTQDFWQEHPSVYVVLDDGIYQYEIFSALKASVKGIVYRLDMEENQLEEEFLQYCTERSEIDTGIVPGVEDRILTLSTCTGSGHASRWIVQGRLAQVYDRAD